MARRRARACRARADSVPEGVASVVRALVLVVTVAVALVASQLRTTGVRITCCCPDPSECHCPDHAAAEDAGPPSLRACHRSAEAVEPQAIVPWLPPPPPRPARHARVVLAVMPPLDRPHAPPGPSAPRGPS